MSLLLREPEQVKQASARHLVAWAWIAIGLVPVGVALSVVVLVSLASLMNVELFPATESEGATFGQGLILSLVTGVVAVAVPIIATILATKAARRAERSAKAARVVAVCLLVLVSAVLLFNVGTVVGAVGVALIGLVLAVALRRGRSASDSRIGR